MPTFSNNTPTTAQPIMLPFTASGDFGGNGAAVHWFSFTTLPDQWMIGMHVTSTGSVPGPLPATDDQPVAEMRLPADPNTSLTPLLYADPRDPIQFPVTPSTAYLIRLTPDDPDETVGLIVHLAPVLAIPAGSWLIPDDNAEMARAIAFDPITGSSLRIIQMPANEFGDVTPSGFLAIGAGDPDEFTIARVEIYGPDLVLIGSVSNPSSPTYVGITTDGTIFYWVASGSTTVRSVDTSAILGGTTGTLGAAWSGAAIAVAYGDDILFYTKGGAAPSIGRFDIGSNTDLTDLVGVVTGYRVTDICAIDDGTVIVAYRKTTDIFDWFIRQYSSGGSVLATYTNAAPTHLVDHMARDPTDLTHVGVWVQVKVASGGLFTRSSIFSRLRLSDMTMTSASPEVVDFQHGYAQTAGVFPSTDQFFGPSDSCPLLILAGALPIASTIGPLAWVHVRRRSA